MTYLKKKKSSKNGGALIVAMGMIFLVGATTSGLFYQGLIHSKFGERTLAQTRSLELANSGIELARYTLRHSASDCFSTEISDHIIFNNVPLGTDGHFTVEVFAKVNDAFSARVVSTGTYTPINTTTKVEMKMTCGYLSALNNYAIVTTGDLFINGNITTEDGDYTYNGIHANESIFLFGAVEIPETGLTFTQLSPITTQPPEGVAINQTATPAALPSVSATVFTQQMSSFFPENSGLLYTFNADGSVIDGAGTTVLAASSTPQTYLGLTYAPPPEAITRGGAEGTASWAITAPSSMTQNTTYIFSDADLSVNAAVGTELNPSKVSLIVQNGNLQANEPVSLAKQDTMGNKTSRAVGMLVDGTSHFLGDVYLKNTTLVNGGTVDVDGTLNLENGALISASDTELAAVNFMHSYDGSPINYHEKTHGDMLEMDGRQTEYNFGEGNVNT